MIDSEMDGVLALQQLQPEVLDGVNPSTASEGGCDTNSTLSTDAGGCASYPLSWMCIPPA